MIKIYYSFIKKEQSKQFVEYVLKKVFNVEGEIKKTENGKPYIENCPYHFNVSHSGELVMVAVSDKPIGIDVEKITDRDYKKISERFFHEKERERVGSLLGFYVLWTKKESFIKYYGKTLSEISKLKFDDKFYFDGKEESLSSVSEKMDDYVFSVCSEEAEYEKFLVM